MKPRSILFLMTHEAGHYTGTFRLARSLRDRGHTVRYLGIADFRQLVVSQGFEFIPFAEDMLPVGYGPAFGASQANPVRGIWPRIKKRWYDERFFKEYLKRVTDGELDTLLQKSNADVVICDGLLWYMALRAKRLKIPVIMLSIVLTLPPNAAIAPIITSVPPGACWYSKAIVLLAWRWTLFKFFFTKRLNSIFFGAYRFPTRMHHLEHLFVKIAKDSGIPCRKGIDWWLTEIGPRIAGTEFVLCPKSFQLPNAPKDGRKYIADFVDTERVEDVTIIEVIPQDKPLVYCSLGSAAPFYPHAIKFFKAVESLSHARKDLHFVLHTAGYPITKAISLKMENLLVMERVPQLALLKQAAVMVTHGGMNSILECLHFKVPMVVVPGLRDQPGNAVRVVHHGLGVATSMKTITAEELDQCIVRVMTDDRIKNNLREIKEAVGREPGISSCIEQIEEVLNITR